MSQKVMTLEAMNKLLDESECLYTADQLKQVIHEMAQEVRVMLACDDELVLMPLMNGGMVFAARLMEALSDLPMCLDYLHASRYQEKTQGGETLEWVRTPTQNLKNKTLLLVDDIFDEGQTLKETHAFLLASGAKKVLTAALVNKIHQRKVADFKPDVVGLDVPDRYVFGFGMDYQGYLRNLQGIYAL